MLSKYHLLFSYFQLICICRLLYGQTTEAMKIVHTAATKPRPSVSNSSSIFVPNEVDSMKIPLGTTQRPSNFIIDKSQNFSPINTATLSNPSNNSEAGDSLFWHAVNKLLDVLAVSGNQSIQHINIFLNDIGYLLNTAQLTFEQLVINSNKLVPELVDQDLWMMKLTSFIKAANQSLMRNCSMKVVGYYTSFGEKEINYETLFYVTHVMYAFPDMGRNGSLSLSDNSTQRLRNLINMTGNFVKPKILISIGGWGKKEEFNDIIRDDESFANFSLNLKSIMEQFDLDGVDMDYEHPGHLPDDKALYVRFMHRMRDALDVWKLIMNKDHLLLTFAGAAGAHDISAGYDLVNLLDGDTVDFVNIMTYDYYGPWPGTASGLSTGPPAPLYFAAPKNYSQQLNVQWTIEKYLCQTKQPDKLVMGVPFYGRYWTSVLPDPVGNFDPMWRVAAEVNVTGGETPYYLIQKDFINRGFVEYYNDKVQASYAWDAENSSYLGYESMRSVEIKGEFAVLNKLAGVSIWAIDYDDDNLSMINALTNNGDLCAVRQFKIEPTKFSCFGERWWSATGKSGLCGPMAPLLNGSYPICDPDDPYSGCCGKWGYCGSGPDFCDCMGCTNYHRFPDKAKKPVAPSVLGSWYTLDYPYELQGRCGYSAPPLNGTIPICNPDNPNGYCCNALGYCSHEPESCNCPSCINFKKNPSYRFLPKKNLTKLWWVWDDGPDKSGQCGPNAPKINGVAPICDPQGDAPCCGPWGYCGATADYCSCGAKCVDYRTFNDRQLREMRILND